MRLSEELAPNLKSGLLSNEAIGPSDTEFVCATMNSKTNIHNEAGFPRFPADHLDEAIPQSNPPGIIRTFHRFARREQRMHYGGEA